MSPCPREKRRCRLIRPRALDWNTISTCPVRQEGAGHFLNNWSKLAGGQSCHNRSHPVPDRGKEAVDDLLGGIADQRAPEPHDAAIGVPVGDEAQHGAAVRRIGEGDFRRRLGKTDAGPCRGPTACSARRRGCPRGRVRRRTPDAVDRGRPEPGAPASSARSTPCRSQPGITAFSTAASLSAAQTAERSAAKGSARRTP